MQLQRKYGLTIQEYMEMYDQQLGLDPITLTPLEEGKICVDHCHKTGRVRGLLSRSTNAALGQLMDSQHVMYRAMQWLSHDSPFGKKSTN